MKIFTLSDHQESSLPSGGADFILCASVTHTCEIEGITQAGIPGKIALTPTLDAEFLVTGKVFSLENMAETATGIPTPGLLTRAVHTLTPFSAVNIIDLGLAYQPQQLDVVDL
ncbi:MAG: nicotinate-nucleotide--dimethylbenzimidazole phosphoribosyltransferase, partial [Sulfurimonadaceae bacterium]